MNVVLEILNRCDTSIELKYICRPVTYISRSSNFALYLEDVLMEECWTEDIDSV